MLVWKDGDRETFFAAHFIFEPHGISVKKYATISFFSFFRQKALIALAMHFKHILREGMVPFSSSKLNGEEGSCRVGSQDGKLGEP